MAISHIISKIRDSFEKKKLSDKPFNNNLDKWNIACVAMDTLEDTQLAIEYYEKNKGSKLDGGKYLTLYGLPQAVYLQRGAIKYLYKELRSNSDKFNYSLTAWNKIRDLRNLTVEIVAGKKRFILLPIKKQDIN